jgi:hypothetical protein
MLEEESLMSPSDPQIKLLLLKNRELYLIGKVTELDEEPSILIENCHEIIECAEYGAEPENLEKRAYSLEGRHLKTSARKIDEGATDKDWFVYEYIILRQYPKFASQRDLFLTSDSIFTILDPEPGVLDLYRKVAG